MHSRYLDEFKVGDVFTTRRGTLTEGQIVDFAMIYDPQHMHIDKQSAEEGPFGGLIASGFQTLGLSFRLFMDMGLITSTNIVGRGMDELRWPAPVYPGDTLHVEAEVLEVTPSRSKPDRGTLRWQFRTYNQKGDVVLTVQPNMILKRRPAE